MSGGPETRLAGHLGPRKERHRQRGRLYRIAFGCAGVVVLAAGAAMLVLPGPGLLVTGIGLTMLALEFDWAERLLLRIAAKLEAARDRRFTRTRD